MIKGVRFLLKYAVGVICWVAVFGFLKSQCIFDVDLVVSGLWMQDLHGGLAKNMLGEIAFRNAIKGGPSQCDDTYIYTVEYHPVSFDRPIERRSLSSLVDLQTWKLYSENSTITTFVDSKHEYLLHRMSGEVGMKVTDR